MKNFFQRDHILIGSPSNRFEIGSHEFLPCLVDRLSFHALLRGFETLRRLKIAEQQSIVTHEQGIVVPSLTMQCRQHLRPDCLMMLLVLVYRFRLHLEQKTDSFHGYSPEISSK